MPSAPTNVRALLDNFDGAYVKITWDDANTTTVSARFWDAAGVEQTFTKNVMTRIAFLPAGTWSMNLKMSNGQQSASVPFTVTAVDPPPPPPPPPPPLTKREQLDAILGATTADGDQIAYYPGPPATVKTVHADGTVS